MTSVLQPTSSFPNSNLRRLLKLFRNTEKFHRFFGKTTFHSEMYIKYIYSYKQRYGLNDFYWENRIIV